MIYADPPQACGDIRGPPNNTKYSGNNWIVLIARLNCSFEDKIRNAQKAGYDAAIVHNVNSNELGNAKFVHILFFSTAVSSENKNNTKSNHNCYLSYVTIFHK